MILRIIYSEICNNSFFVLRSRLVVFREGMSLFCKLCTNDKLLTEKRAAVEWSYFNLLSGTRRMFRKVPEISDSEGMSMY